ncbi:hypothetical protein JP0145_10750 [Helicobacter pylori]
MSYSLILIVEHFRAIYLGFNEWFDFRIKRDVKTMTNHYLIKKNALLFLISYLAFP